MENRDRDRVSQRTSPTDAGELNRSVEEEKGRRQHSGTTAEFGQNIGESEFLNDKGETMQNKNKNDVSNSNVDRDRESGLNRDRESTRRSGQGNYGSSSGRSSGSSNEIGSDRSSNIDSGSDRSSDRSSSGELGSTSRSEGRH